MDHAELLLQNCHDFSFETEQITSFGCDQRTRVNRFAFPSDETEQGVNPRRRDLEGFGLGDASARDFVDLGTRSIETVGKDGGGRRAPNLRQT